MGDASSSPSVLPANIMLLHVALPLTTDADWDDEIDDFPEYITHNFDRGLLPTGQRHIALVTRTGDDSICAFALLRKETGTSTYQSRVRLREFEALER